MKSIDEHDLQAFVDGQLDPARTREVAGYLEANAEAAEKVAAYRKQNDLLHALFDPSLSEPLPARLTPPQRPRTDWLRHAAVVGALAIGIGIGYAARGPGLGGASPQLALSHQAVAAHVAYTPEVLHPVEVGAGQEAHLVKWLSKRLGATVKPPHLAEIGFELMGGRLLPGGATPAAQFMYQDKRGQRLTLYVRRDAKAAETTAFRFAEEGPVKVFYWVDRDFGYALSGELPKADLLRVAEAVYTQSYP